MFISLHKFEIIFTKNLISNWFQLQRILSCSLEILKNDWTSVMISNRTNYEIFDVIPNAQYCIQVQVANDNINTQQDTQICALTHSKSKV